MCERLVRVSLQYLLEPRLGARIVTQLNVQRAEVLCRPRIQAPRQGQGFFRCPAGFPVSLGLSQGVGEAALSLRIPRIELGRVPEGLDRFRIIPHLLGLGTECVPRQGCVRIRPGGLAIGGERSLLPVERVVLLDQFELALAKGSVSPGFGGLVMGNCFSSLTMLSKMRE